MVLNMWVVYDWFKRRGYDIGENISSESDEFEYLYLDENDHGHAILTQEQDHWVILCGSSSICIRNSSSWEITTQFFDMQALYSEWEKESLQSLIHIRNPQSLVDIALRTFNRPICFKNNEELVFGQTDDFESMVAQLQQQTPPEEWRNQKPPSLQKLETSKEPLVYYSAVYNSVVAQVNLWKRGQNVGKVLILENSIPFSRGDIYLISRLAEFMNLFIANDRSDLFSGTGVSALLVDLVRNKPISIENLQSIYQVKKWSYNDEFLILCVQDIFDGETPMKRAFRSALSSKFPHCQLIFYEDVLGIVNITKTGPYHTVMSQLHEAMPSEGARWGSSYPFKGLERMSTYYKQAQMSIQYAKQTDRIYADTYDIALHHMSDTLWADSCCNHMLHPDVSRLIALDQADSTEYARTLMCYLLSGMNYTDTAQKLEIHRNTVIYRIGKISDLMDTDLNHPENQKLLLFSCLVLESHFPKNSYN